jgi:hypothetical protein
LSVLVSALEAWGASRAAAEFNRRALDELVAAEVPAHDVTDDATQEPGASLLLETEATVLLAAQPRVQSDLEGFLKRNCRL